MNILKRIVSFWTSVPAKNHISDLANAYNGNIAMVQENGVWRVVLVVRYVQQPQYLSKDNCFYPKSICEGETLYKLSFNHKETIQIKCYQ